MGLNQLENIQIQIFGGYQRTQILSILENFLKF